MDRQPRPPKESIFARGVGVHVLWVGFWMGMVTLISFIYMLDKYGGEIWDPLDADLKMARSMAFFVLATTQVFHVTAIHAGHASFFEAPVWRNRILLFAIALTIALQVGAIYLPFMNTLLDTEPLKLGEFALAFVFAASILPAVEVEKALWRRREAAQQAETPSLLDDA
jgi:Ca2+-transporting ATPase